MTPTQLPTTAPVLDGQMRLMSLPIGGRTLRLRLRLEGESPFGSVKARTAQALLDSLEAGGLLGPGGHVVESTSGNLGIALAGLAAEHGYRCTLMVDASTSAFSLRRMKELGAELVHVAAPDPAHAVAARVQAVRDYLHAHPGAAWTDQYSNPAGPAIHAATTAPALLHHPGLPLPDAIAAPVSTGGTLAGIAAHTRTHAPGVRIWAVDAVASAATGRTAAHRPAKIPGFGSGLRSEFLDAAQLDHVAYIADQAAALACRIIAEHTGLQLGGSAGATILAAVVAALRSRTVTDVACLCPDGGDRYQDTIYNPRHTPPDLRQLARHPALAALTSLRLDAHAATGDVVR